MTRVILLAGVVSLVLTGCSVSDVEDKLRFGWPSGVTKQAEKMRELWTWSSVAALVLGIIVWGLMFWCSFRYRKRNDRLPRQTKYNFPLEITYTIIPLLVVAGLFYFTVRTENYVDKRSANPDVVVQVNAFKWNWQFQYHTYHGTQLRYTNVPEGATGQAPYVSTTGTSTQIPVLVIPRGQTVRVIEHSLDVIHSFWVPEFLFKRDVIPYNPENRQAATNADASANPTVANPRDNQFEFTATVDGSYVGRCAELCGTYHSEMNFEVRVVEPSAFQAYVTKLASLGPNDALAQYTALASIGGSPCATKTHPFTSEIGVDTKAKVRGVCT